MKSFPAGPTMTTAWRCRWKRTPPAEPTCIILCGEYSHPRETGAAGFGGAAAARGDKGAPAARARRSRPMVVARKIPHAAGNDHTDLAAPCRRGLVQTSSDFGTPRERPAHAPGTAPGGFAVASGMCPFRLAHQQATGSCDVGRLRAILFDTRHRRGRRPRQPSLLAGMTASASKARSCAQAAGHQRPTERPEGARSFQPSTAEFQSDHGLETPARPHEFSRRRITLDRRNLRFRLEVSPARPQPECAVRERKHHRPRQSLMRRIPDECDDGSSRRFREVDERSGRPGRVVLGYQ